MLLNIIWLRNGILSVAGPLIVIIIMIINNDNNNNNNNNNWLYWSVNVSTALVLIGDTFQARIEFWNVGLPLGAEKSTNNKLNPYMTPGPGTEPRTHWEVSTLTTAPSLLHPYISRVIICWYSVAVHAIRTLTLSYQKKISVWGAKLNHYSPHHHIADI